MFKTCPKCHTQVLDPIQCSNCQLIFAKYLELSGLHKKIQWQQQAQKYPEARDSFQLKLLTFPLVLIATHLMDLTFLKNFFIYFKVWVHELGHALMSWMSGVKATPISFGNRGMTFNSGLDRSTLVFLCFIFLLSYGYFYAKKNKAPFLKWLTIALGLLSIFFTWVSSSKNVEMFIIFAGFGGEIILSTLFILAFNHRLPAKWHWQNFFRWPVLILGFFILLSATKDWLDVYSLKSLNTFGENYSEEYGDFNRLILDYDWSLQKFMRVYVSLVVTCWCAVLASYIYFLKNSAKKIKKSW